MSTIEFKSLLYCDLSLSLSLSAEEFCAFLFRENKIFELWSY
jgi:hypothetical protein